jgi:hypothetical protein
VDRTPFFSRDHIAVEDLGVVHTSLLLIARKNPLPLIHTSYLPATSRADIAARAITLGRPISKLADGDDIKSSACVEYFAAMREPAWDVKHRKQWEFCMMTHALDALGMLEKGRTGVGFAVGTEPLASYFVSRGADVTVSDMPINVNEHEASKWNTSFQHATQVEATWRQGVVPKETYLRKARFVPVDMNNLPPSLLTASFDFAWSSSSMEHLGTCRQGIDFFLRSMAALKPGGVAVHTTELRIDREDVAADLPHLCFFSRSMIDGLLAELTAAGHEVLGPMRYLVGVRGADDVDRTPFFSRDHIAVEDLGVVHTSLLLVVRK